MAGFKYTARHYRQPLDPVRIAAAWRSRVMSAWYPNAGVDVVRNVVLTETDPGGWWSRQGDKWVGLGAAGDGGANYLDLGVLSSPGDATRISTLTIATPSDTSIVRSSLFDTSNNASIQGFCLNQGYGLDRTKAFVYNNNNFVAEANAGTFANGVRAVYGVSYSKTNPTNTVKIYKNGVEIISSSFDTAADVAYGQKYCPGGRVASPNTKGWAGSLELQVLFPPVLTAAEFWALSQNPWQLFEPIRRAIFFAPAAAGAPTHDATGVLTGPGSTVAGTAEHLTLHATTGVLTGPGSTVAGVAAHHHAATGALAGPGSTVAGTAAHLTLHTSTGTLAGAGSTVAGSAAHEHAATGALTGPGSTVVGAAERAAAGQHDTTGVLTGAGSTIVGAAVHPHTTAGVLAGAGSTITGASTHTAPVVHTTTGDLVGVGASISGTATRLALHTTSGILVGAGSTVTGAVSLNGAVAEGAQVGGWGPDPKRGKRRKPQAPAEADPREIRKELEALLETAQGRLEDKPVPKAKQAAADYRGLAAELARAQRGSVPDMLLALEHAKTLLTTVERERVAAAREARTAQRRRRNRQLAILLATMD